MGRPKSGASAPKNRRLSAIDRASMAITGEVYKPPASQPMPERPLISPQKETPRQLLPIVAAPAKTEEKKVTKKAVAKPAATKPAPTRINRPNPQPAKPKAKGGVWGDLAAKIKAAEAETKAKESKKEE